MMPNQKTATFTDLIARKLEREQRREKTYEIPVRGMERPLMMTHPSAQAQLELMEEVRTAEGLADVAELYVSLIYDCCPLFRQKETQEALEAVDPYDAIRSVFEPLEIIDIGDRFCRACGITDEQGSAEGEKKPHDLIEKVKN